MRLRIIERPWQLPHARFEVEADGLCVRVFADELSAESFWRCMPRGRA